MGTKLKLDLSALCTRRVEREGKALRAGNALHNPMERKQPDGTLLFTAKVCDAFNFVDHPVLIANAAGTRIREYRCNCPDYINRRSFCEHCAALALEFLQEQQRTLSPVSVFDLFPMPQEDTENVPGESAEEVSAPAALGPACVEDLSYWFCNCDAHLYPGQQNPRIPLKRYQQVFGKNAIALMLYRRHTTWGGSCYGFTFTSAMLTVADSGIDLADFSGVARIPSQLQLDNVASKLNMTLHEFIEASQIIQYDNAFISRPRVEWLNRADVLENLAEKVSAFQATGENPVGICVYADRAYRGGHEVFPYRFERREGNSDVVHIYDPNWPMQTRYAYLEKDAEGHYVNWRFQMTGSEEYSGEKGGLISVDSYEAFKQAWDNRGSDAVRGMMNTNQAMSVMNAEGDMLVCVTEAGVQSRQADIYQMPLTDEPADAGMLLQIPEGQYLVRNDEADKAELALTYANSQCLLALNTQARMAEIVLNQERELACAVISEPGCAFSIEFETVSDADIEQVKLEGITGEQPLCFAKQQNDLYGTGISWGEEIRLYRNGIQVDAVCIRELNREVPQEIEYETNASAGDGTDENP